MNVGKTLLIGLFSVSIAHAQSPAPAATSLQDQFVELKNDANTFQDYKVVKKVRLDSFWNTVTDSLNAHHEELTATHQQVGTLRGEVSGLKTQLNEQVSRVETLEYEKARLNFLGLDLMKDTYSTVVWGLIFALLIATLVALYRYRMSHRITANTRRDHLQLQAEFEEFRRRTHEREVRIKRELQTERNRVEEMKQKLPIYR